MTNYFYTINLCSPCSSDEINKCHECNLVFSSRSSLIKHNKSRIHANDKRECNLCGTFFPISILKMHQKNVHGIELKPPKITTVQQNVSHKSGICEYCGKTFKKLRDHVKEVHQKKRKCPICKEMFTNITMKEHYKTEHNIFYPKSTWIGNNEHQKKKPDVSNIYKCQSCDRKFTSNLMVEQHIRIDHPEDYEKLTAINSITGQADQNINGIEPIAGEVEKNPVILSGKCQICNQTFIRLDQHLKEVHINSIKKVTIRKCDRCDKIFPTLRSLDNHKRNDHTDKYGDLIRKVTPNKHYSKCEICDKLYPDRKRGEIPSYIQHYLAVHGEVPPEFKGKKG